MHVILYNIYYVSRSRMYLCTCQRTISFDISSRTSSAAHMHYRYLKIFYCKTNTRGEHVPYLILYFLLKFWFLELLRLLKDHNTYACCIRIFFKKKSITFFRFLCSHWSFLRNYTSLYLLYIHILIHYYWFRHSYYKSVIIWLNWYLLFKFVYTYSKIAVQYTHGIFIVRLQMQML